MKFSETAQYRANTRYNRRVYEILSVRVKKGIRNDFKAEAERVGKSLARLVVDSVQYCIKNGVWVNKEEGQ